MALAGNGNLFYNTNWGFAYAPEMGGNGYGCKHI